MAGPDSASAWASSTSEHLVRRQGRRARHRGIRRDLFDVRRASAIQELEAIQRKAA